jgi:hypothetical protein
VEQIRWRKRETGGPPLGKSLVAGGIEERDRPAAVLKVPCGALCIEVMASLITSRLDGDGPEESMTEQPPPCDEQTGTPAAADPRGPAELLAAYEAGRLRSRRGRSRAAG